MYNLNKLSARPIINFNEECHTMFGAVDTNLTTIGTGLQDAMTNADGGVLATIGAFSGLLGAVVLATIAVIVIRKMIKKAYSPAKRV